MHKKQGWLRSQYFLPGLILLQVLCTLVIKPPKEKILFEDAVYYYSWLPAAFVRHDLSLSFLDRENQLPNQFFHNQLSDGRRVFKMPPGVALGQLPFFFMAHAVHGFAGDGFSLGYQQWLRFGAICYWILGAVFLRRFLRRRFDETTCNLVLVILGLGSNLYYYAFMESGMSHVFTFFAFSWLLVLFGSDQMNFRTAVTIGFVVGWLFLIRHTNIILILSLGILLVSDRQLRSHWQNQPFRLVVAGFIAGMMALGQLFYLRYATGHWFTNSYVGEQFFFNQPEIAAVLFSFRKGWFVYTPLMLLILPGFVMMFKAKDGLRWAILLPVLLFLYVISSWWCWWYGGSWGMRAMIDAYPLLSVPLGYAVLWMRTSAFRKLALSGISMLMILNLYQTYQYQQAIIHWDAMTLRSYTTSFAMLKTPKTELPGLVHPDYAASRISRQIYEWK